VAVIALFYIWIGAAAQGWDRILGLGGGVLILAAITTIRRSVPAAYVLLVVGGHAGDRASTTAVSEGR
jgi:hypothetical protein